MARRTTGRAARWPALAASLAAALALAGCRGQAGGSETPDPDAQRRLELERASAKAVAAFNAPVLSVEEARTKLASAKEDADKPLLVDARQPAEYDASHLPGAIVWDVDADDAMPETLLLAGRDGRPVLFYCSIGYRSGKACERYRDAFPAAPAWNVEGGLFLWAESGDALEGGAKVHPYDAKWGALLRPDLRAPLKGEETK